MTKSGGVRVSSRTGSHVQIPSRMYLSHVDREFFHYAGRWSVVISGTVKSAAVADLIAPGFMATLMVHLALTRLDGGIPRRAFACVRATIRKYLVKTLGWVRARLSDLIARACVHTARFEEPHRG